MLFLKLHPASKNKRVILFHKSHEWKMTRGDIHLHVNQNRETIPEPIKVFKSAVLLVAQLHSYCFTMLQAVQDIYEEGTY